VDRGGSVRLIGDDQQLAAIGAGGVLRDIQATHGAVRLAELLRFADPAEGAASLALREGQTEALGFYLDCGRVHVGDLASMTEDVFTAWAADRGNGLDSIMLYSRCAAPPLLRAFTVSANCVALSLATHLIGAGSGVPRVSVVALLGLLVTTVLLTLALAALSGRRWTLGRSLVALGSGQVGLHAIFTMLLTSPGDHSPMGQAGGMSMGSSTGSSMSMALAHTVAALLIGVGIAVSDSALDTYFCLALSRVGSGTGVLSPWRLAALIPFVAAVDAVRAAGRSEHYLRWQRPRILTDLIVSQCLSRRGPPAPALAS
jgi:AAA domain